MLSICLFVIASELERLKEVFTAKERDLMQATSRVDQLSKKLDDLQRGQQNGELASLKHEIDVSIFLCKNNRCALVGVANRCVCAMHPP